METPLRAQKRMKLSTTWSIAGSSDNSLVMLLL